MSPREETLSVIYASPAQRGKLPAGLKGALCACSVRLQCAPFRLRHLPPLRRGREPDCDAIVALDASPRRNVHARRTSFGARRSKGFTLIEMIAAFVIFAIAIGSLMQILTMSLNNARRSLDETRAALWAQSLLDNVGVGERIEAGSSNGEFDRIYHWEMDIEQIDPQLVEATTPGALGDAAVATQVGNPGSSPISEVTQMELYHVQLRVVWGGGNRERSALFTTLRSAMPDLAQGASLGGAGIDSAQGDKQPAGSQFTRTRKPATQGRR